MVITVRVWFRCCRCCVLLPCKVHNTASYTCCKLSIRFIVCACASREFICAAARRWFVVVESLLCAPFVGASTCASSIRIYIHNQHQNHEDLYYTQHGRNKYLRPSLSTLRICTCVETYICKPRACMTSMLYYNSKVWYTTNDTNTRDQSSPARASARIWIIVY